MEQSAWVQTPLLAHSANSSVVECNSSKVVTRVRFPFGAFRVRLHPLQNSNRLEQFALRLEQFAPEASLAAFRKESVRQEALPPL